MFLQGKTALVTGSTSGIGLAIARALAGEGARVILNGFGDAAEIARLQEELGAGYSNADLTSPPAIEAMMAEAGPIDILVNNAGTQHVAPVDAFPPEKWDLILALNLSAVFHTTRLALPAMKDKGWGRVINTASAHSLVASPNKSAYVAAKHGVAGFTKTVALEVARDGVTVNCISPGYVWTPLVESQIPDTDGHPRPHPRAGDDRRPACRPADQAIRHRRSGRGARLVPLPRRGGQHHWREPQHGRRLDGGLRPIGCKAPKYAAGRCARSRCHRCRPRFRSGRIAAFRSGSRD